MATVSPVVSAPGPSAPATVLAPPIRVLVVDDSASTCRLMTELLDADPGIVVVGTAADAFIAREQIKRLAPDVITLDVEMPRMDGLTFLRNLMRLRPMPVVMVSSLTTAGAAVTLDALAVGAVDFVTKPRLEPGQGMAGYRALLIEKVKQAATAQVGRLPAATAPARQIDSGEFRSAGRLLAIGASAGGTEAIRAVLECMPADAPPILLAQHIPAAFSAAFAQRLDHHSAMTVVEARCGDRLQVGHAYLAPGGRHLRVVRSGAHWICRLGEDDPVRRHRPSVDVLFASVAAHAGARASAALLTGMGDDGARGLLALREVGGATFAQDQASSVVWGMPGAAVALDAAQEVVPLSHIAERLLASTLRT